MTDQTLAQLVRAKYPGAYDDLSDQQLESAVLAKFPGVYDDLPRSGSQASPEPPPTQPAPVAKHPYARFGEMVTDALPAIGGTIGGLLGAPGIATGAAGAALGGAAGEAGKQLLNRAMGREAPDSPMEAAQGIATQGAVQGAIEGAGGLATKGIAKGATAVYRGYLKPSLAGTELPKARQIVETAMRENLPISQAGETRGKLLISQINSEVNKALKDASVGKPVDLHQIAEKVRTFARRTYNKPGAPPGDLAAALKVADDIDQHASIGLPPGAKPTRVNVTPERANETKQALDKAIGDTGFGVERGAATEARKVGRFAARTAIEDAVPAVKALNKRESELIDAIEAVAKATGREENRNAIFGVPSLMALGVTGSTGAYQQDPAAGIIAGLVTRGLLTAPVASRAAILAARFASVPGTTATLAARMGAVLALRESEEQGQGGPRRKQQ